MIPQITFLVWIKSSLEKFAWGGIILYALRHKRNVAAKYGNGTFEIIATGDTGAKKLE